MRMSFIGKDGDRAEMYIIKKELLPLLFNKLEWVKQWND